MKDLIFAFSSFAYMFTLVFGSWTIGIEKKWRKFYGAIMIASSFVFSVLHYKLNKGVVES